MVCYDPKSSSKNKEQNPTVTFRVLKSLPLQLPSRSSQVTDISDWSYKTKCVCALMFGNPEDLKC